MKDCSANNDVYVNIEFDKLPEIIEYIKRLKRERDYYKKIVDKYLKIFKLNDQ